MWSLAYDRTPTHGYEPTREAPCGHSPGVWEFVRQVFRILSRVGIAPMRLAPLVALTSAVICGLLFGCSPAAMGLLLSSRTQENMITTAASSLQSSAK